MHYLLNKNVCVTYLNGWSRSVCDRHISIPIEDMTMCSVVKAELFYGVMQSNNLPGTLKRQQKVLGRFVSLPSKKEVVIACSQIRVRLAGTGTSIGAYALQIAAIALANNLILVTHDTREFKRVDGL